jgi:protein-S-isoprenylcysteine O-methyltransferase Ste14
MYTKSLESIDVLFNHRPIRIFLGRLRYPICLFLLIFLVFHIERSLLLPGFLISLFGEMIQIWSFASLDKNRKIATRGLYSLLRNPMYIGRFFLLAGCLLLINKILIIPAFAVVYFFYMINRVRREEVKLRETFGEEYETYCSRVNRFMPSFRRFNLKYLLYFKWNLLVQNNGHWNLAVVLSIYLFFYIFTLMNSGVQ